MDDSRNLPPDALAERLQAVLAPRPETVERIVHGALRSSSAEIAPRWRPALAAALLGGMALLFAWQLRPARQPAAISIVNEGGVVIATSPDRAWLVRSADAEPARPGTIIVSYGGVE